MIIDSIKYYYINLEHRTDRNRHIVEQFQRFGINSYERIPAIQHECGHKGCSQSHILAIKTFIESEHEYCVVLEDDFEFVINVDQYKELLNKLESGNIDWNVVLLSANLKHFEDYNSFLKLCVESQTASGYMVKKQYASTLLENYTEGFNLFCSDNSDERKHSLDQYWKKLQGRDKKWFVFDPRCGRQMRGFSDIEKTITFYGC